MNQPMQQRRASVLPLVWVGLLIGISSGRVPAQSIQTPLAVTRPFPENGLYQTANDYEQRHLTDFFSSGQPGYRFRPKSPLYGYVKLITPNKVIRADASTYWGCRWQGHDYRFYQGDTYEVIDQEGIVVYARQTFLSGGIGEDYYFSLSDRSAIQWLSRKQLYRAFANNPAMIRLLRKAKHTGNWLRPSPPDNRPLIQELYHLSQTMLPPKEAPSEVDRIPSRISSNEK